MNFSLSTFLSHPIWLIILVKTDRVESVAETRKRFESQSSDESTTTPQSVSAYGFNFPRFREYNFGMMLKQISVYFCVKILSKFLFFIESRSSVEQKFWLANLAYSGVISDTPQVTLRGSSWHEF